MTKEEIIEIQKEKLIKLEEKIRKIQEKLNDFDWYEKDLDVGLIFVQEVEEILKEEEERK